MSLLEGFKLFFSPSFVAGLLSFYGGGKGGGGSSAPQQVTSTTTTTNLPEYAKPYYQELLKQTGREVFQTNASGRVTGMAPYEAYTGQRIAGFTPEQLAIQQEVWGMMTPEQFAQAQTGLTAGQYGSLGAMGAGLAGALSYMPQSYTGMAVQAPWLQDYQMSAAQTDYNPQLAMFQMDSPGSVYSRDFTSLQPDQMQAYMSPYQQAVTDSAIRAAQLEADRQRAQAAMGSISRGTFGGARDTLAQSLAKANTMQTVGDIQSRGSQEAFNQAIQQFNADEARRLGAQQFNVQTNLAQNQANLQAALGVQQLGTETGLRTALANLDAQQQANVQNLASNLQTQGLGADQALRAALANQATQLDYTKLNEQTQQFSADLGKDIFGLGLSGLTDTSKALGVLGATQQEADLARLQAQALSAGEQQALAQRALDLQYQQAMEARDWNKTQLQFYSDLLRGNAGALGSTQTATTSAPAPSTASQIAGLGLAGLGLYKAMS